MARMPTTLKGCAAALLLMNAASLLVGFDAQAQVLPPWRVDDMASRDVNDWLEFAQPSLPSSDDKPVDDAQFAALAAGGPWSPRDWQALSPEVSSLFMLARRGAWSEMLKSLSDTNAGVDARDVDGATLLTLAARAGRLDVTRELLRRGAQVERVGLFGLSPLGAAALAGHDLVVQELLRAGADAARWSGQGQPPLHLAARGGHVAVMRSLLKAGAQPLQFNREGRHALAEAARTGQVVSMSWLIDQAKVPVNAPDAAGLNAVHAAALGRHAEAVAWLQQQGGRLPHPLTSVLLERDPDPLPLR